MRKTVYLYIFILSLIVTGCKSTKYVPDNKLLLVKNKIHIDDGKKDTRQLYPYLIQRPNSGNIFRFKLHVFNLHNPDYIRKWDARLTKYRDTSHWFTRIFSYKQAKSYVRFRKNLNQWAIEKGEPPVIISMDKTRQTAENLKKRLIDLGYFKSHVTYRIDTTGNKKGKVNYYIHKGKPTYIDSLKVHIASPVIDSLYRIYRKGSLIRKGQIYRRKNLEEEAARLTRLFRNAGVYHFSRFAIGFFEIDTIQNTGKTSVLLDIADRIIDQGDSIQSVPYRIMKIRNVKVYTDYSFQNKDLTPNDSIRYNGIDYLASGERIYNPKKLDKYIFITPGDVYSDLNVERTRKHLRNLNNFKSIRISFTEEDDKYLTARIFLTPQNRYSFKAEGETTHENIKPFGISGRASLLNRNLNKGGENLQFAVKGSFYSSLIQNENTSSGFFNALEWGVDIKYKIPGFFPNPLTHKNKKNQMSPLTTIQTGYSNQKNIGLDKERFSFIYQYDWNPAKHFNHHLEIFNAQYIRNLNTNSFFDIYRSERRKLETIYEEYYQDQTSFEPVNDFMTLVLEDENLAQTDPDAYRLAQNVKQRFDIITEDILVPASSYQFTYNTQKVYTDADYHFFKFNFTTSGLLLCSILPESDTDTPKQLNGINIAQYIKTDLDYRRYWALPGNGVLAFRASLGLAFPYGNSDAIPFSRSYFAGGPNDIRAWQIYELGPGSEHSGLEFNVGNMKFISSLEYRFDVIGNFMGALFADAGNIWDTRGLELVSDQARFRGFSSLSQLALGTGVGIRYNFSFLILRTDFGFKTYIPYEKPGKRWLNKNYLNPVLNLGINYPF